MKKRIRLTIEWDGAADEHGYAQMCAKAVEEGDRSRVTTVTKIEWLTDHGYTPGQHPVRARKPPTFWKELGRFLTPNKSARDTGFR